MPLTFARYRAKEFFSTELRGSHLAAAFYMRNSSGICNGIAEQLLGKGAGSYGIYLSKVLSASGLPAAANADRDAADRDAVADIADRMN